MVFSILFCVVSSDRVSAFTLVGADNTGTIHNQFSTVWSTYDGSTYSEQTYTCTIHLNKFLEIGKFYLISGGMKKVDTLASAHNSYDYTLSVDYYYLINGVRYESGINNFVVQGNSNDYFEVVFEVKATVFPYLYINGADSHYVPSYLTPIIDCEYWFNVYELLPSEASSYVGQSGVVGSLEKGNDLQQKNNDLQKEQNETSKGILGKITDFFGSFFENLKGLFVPEDGYFSDFFTRLNDFFSEKLGMLYAPIDMFITFLNTIKDASSTESGITFPELAWDGTVVIPETKFNFNSITKDFPDLQEKIYFVTDVIMVGAVLWLLQSKLKEVLEN